MTAGSSGGGWRVVDRGAGETEHGFERVEDQRAVHDGPRPPVRPLRVRAIYANSCTLCRRTRNETEKGAFTRSRDQHDVRRIAAVSEASARGAAGRRRPLLTVLGDGRNGAQLELLARMQFGLYGLRRSIEGGLESPGRHIPPLIAHFRKPSRHLLARWKHCTSGIDLVPFPIITVSSDDTPANTSW